MLSACETAQGTIDYSEGVYGLVRALRTAGASNVLVTLRPVGDTSSRDFMRAFYQHWLQQTRSDPAAALRATQRQYISKNTPQHLGPLHPRRRKNVMGIQGADGVASAQR